MKVSDQNTSIQMNAYIKQVQQPSKQADDSKTSAAGQQATGDKVQLSDQAKQLQQATQKASESGDVRQEKVQQVQLEVESGTYKVNSAQVATDMLNETLENNMILQKVSTRP